MHRVETERAGHSAWSAARRWQMMRGAAGEEQPGASQKASHLTCAHRVPHLPLPDAGRQVTREKQMQPVLHHPSPPAFACYTSMCRSPDGRSLRTTNTWRTAPWLGHGEEEVLWHTCPAMQSIRQLCVKAAAVCCHRSNQLRGRC